MAEQRYRVQINYKSGRSIEVTAEAFKTGFNGADLTSIDGTAVSPMPLFFGLNEIESIWDLGPVDISGKAK